jgi:N-dimethylarginine dimethylaminohydrolase
MKKVLLCPPTRYDIEYEINPWMHLENKVDQTAALRAYAHLKETFVRLGLEVYEIPQAKGLPDMVYTANVGYLIDGVFIKANFMYRERREEARQAQQFLEREFGVITSSLPEGVYFEGQGDLLSDGERYFFGWGKRSHYEAKDVLQHLMGVRLIDLKLVDPYYYHLDTCFAPLTPDLVVINPRSFTDEGKKTIRSSFSHVIEADPESNEVLACNLVRVGKDIVIGKGISESLKENLAKFGYTTHEIDMREYLKGGGSVKCCTFEFDA